MRRVGGMVGEGGRYWRVFGLSIWYTLGGSSTLTGGWFGRRKTGKRKEEWPIQVAKKLESILAFIASPTPHPMGSLGKTPEELQRWCGCGLGWMREADWLPKELASRDWCSGATLILSGLVRYSLLTGKFCNGIANFVYCKYVLVYVYRVPLTSKGR